MAFLEQRGDQYRIIVKFLGQRCTHSVHTEDRGVDQRLINVWVGHKAEEMVQRYRPLFPTQERQAIELVFG